MTPDDALERELEALRPLPPSPQLRRRVGAELNRRRWAGPAALALAAVAAVAAVVVLTRPGRPPAPNGPPPAVAATPPPTVQAYRAALARSPESLEALLDRQAVRTSRNGPPARTTAFAPPGLLASRGLRE